MSTSSSMSSERPINLKTTIRASWVRVQIKQRVVKQAAILSICKSILMQGREMRWCPLGWRIRSIAMRASPTFLQWWRITSQASIVVLRFRKVRVRLNLPIRRENRWPGSLGQYTRGCCWATSRRWVDPWALGSLQRMNSKYHRFRFNNPDHLHSKAPFQNSREAAWDASPAADTALKSEQARLS